MKTLHPIPPPRTLARRLLTLALSCVLGLTGLNGLAPSAAAATVPTGFTETQIFSGLTRPTRIGFAPDGRIFVLSQGGSVRIVKNGTLLSTPFLTLPVSNLGERGILGIELDPGFATNRWVYLYYTATSPTIHNRISRFTASSTNPDVVQAGSEVVIFDSLPTLSDIYHNGGDIHISPTDGKLYVAVGDDKVSWAPQSTGSLLGKILRLNTDGSIPTDNPFYTSAAGSNRAIWARGLRNPFSFTFHPTSGAMYLIDVGEATYEEVNLGASGANYGWPNYEGPTTAAGFTSPLFAYHHTQGIGGCAIVGAALYTPSVQQFPSSYSGKFFYADHCGKYIRTLDLATQQTTAFASGMDNPVGVFVGPDGSVYYLTANTGALFQIKYTSAPSISQQPQSQTVTAGSVATFTVTAGGSSPLSYQWQRGTANIAGATSATYAFTAVAADNGATFRCRVTNTLGIATSNSATLTITSNANAPVPAITSPALYQTFRYGDTLAFAGTANDVEDGALPLSALTWAVDFHHNTHRHDFIPPFSGVNSGTFTLPLGGETASDVWFRVLLTATDSEGRATTVSRDVLPRLADVTLTTVPTGLTVTLDGQPFVTPTTFTGVEGLRRLLGAATSQTLGGTTYAFQSWSNGGESTHEIFTPAAATTFTANYAAVTLGAPVTFEAESLTNTSNGPAIAPKVDTGASNGNWLQLDSTLVGNTWTFTTGSLPAGTYEVRFRYKSFTPRGQCSVSIDGTQLGAIVDQYSAASAFPIVTLGTRTFAAGPRTITLQVTGRNAASTSYNLAADSFIFVPQGAGEVVEAPHYILPGDTYHAPVSVTLASNTAGSTIRYTLDGSTPSTTSGLLYTGPVTINTTATLRSIATKSGATASAVTSATYVIAAAPPTFSPGGNANLTPPAAAYSGAQIVTLASATPGCSLRYTLDGSAPSATAGTLYTGPITVAASATLRAVAYKTGIDASAVSSAGYVIDGASAINDEFETMTVQASSGDAIFVVADAACSGGQWSKFNSNAIGDYIIFAHAVNAGTYRIEVKIKSFTDRATVQLATSGVATGPFYDKDGPKEFYAAASGYPTIAYTALVTFPDAGVKYFRFTVTGKNAASTGYVVPLDALILTPQ